jgi:cytoskeletal protein RodZ
MDPQVEKPAKKRRGKFKLIVLLLVFFFCLLLSLFVAGVVFAFTSNKNVPVFSSVVEGLENVVASDDMVAEKVQNDMTDSIFSMLLPLASDKAATSSVVNLDVSEEDIKSFIDDEITYDSSKYSVNTMISVTSAGSAEELGSAAMFLNGNFNIKMSGEVSQKVGEEKMSMDIDASYEASGTVLSAKGELRTIGEDSYFKVESLPTLGLVDLSALTNQWISMKAEDLGALSSTATTSEEIKITKEDLQDLNDLIHSDEIKNSINKLDDEVIEGVRTYCFEMVFDQQNLGALLLKANGVLGENGETLSAEELGESLKNIDSLIVTVCSGRRDKLIYKMNLDVVLSDESSVGGTIKVESKMWDYNKTVEVEEPSNAITLEQAYEALMPLLGGLSGAGSTVPEDSSLDEWEGYEFE